MKKIIRIILLLIFGFCVSYTYYYTHRKPLVSVIITTYDRAHLLPDIFLVTPPTRQNNSPLSQIIYGNVMGFSGIVIKKEFLDKHHIRFHKKFMGAEDYAFWHDVLTNNGIFGVIQIFWLLFVADLCTQKNTMIIKEKQIKLFQTH